MPESAEELHARVVGLVGAGGRLPTPEIAEWETFPWEVADGAIVVKPLAAPGGERPREGEDGGGPCIMCAGYPADLVVWEDERWLITRFEKPSGVPLVLTLWTREHLDFGDLDDDLASELGRISNRLVRIVEGLPHIARVHVNRWGDGNSHLHVWFIARPEGLVNLRGSYATEWMDILPPGPEDVWHADLHTVATKLANWGGRARA